MTENPYQKFHSHTKSEPKYEMGIYSLEFASFFFFFALNERCAGRYLSKILVVYVLYELVRK